MLDTHILADRVSLLLKTRYAQTPLAKRPFDQAFTDVMNEAEVIGSARGAVKSEIGKILSSRPKKNRAKKDSRVMGCQAQFSFGIAKATRGEVILTSPTGGQELIFRRDRDGRVVNTAFTGGCSTQVLITRAKELAEKLFAEKDREAIEYDRVRILTREDNHMVVIIASKYEARISRGQGRSAVVTTVTCDGEAVVQKIVPLNLLREAKAIAKQYFKGVGTQSLPFV